MTIKDVTLTFRKDRSYSICLSVCTATEPTILRPHKQVKTIKTILSQNKNDILFNKSTQSVTNLTKDLKALRVLVIQMASIDFLKL